MDPDEAGKWLPLYEMLGMNFEDAVRITRDFDKIIKESTSPGDMCKRVVDQYGVDAVCTSMCLYLALERLATVKSDIDMLRMMQCPSRN